MFDQFLDTINPKRKEARAIKNVREHFAFFGIETSDLSDDQIKNLCVKIAVAIKDTGIEADVVMQGLREMLAAHAHIFCNVGLTKEKDK